ncbi:MAG: heavy metal translocating P-type ATPase, partial [Micrococcales bacterium]|nr:heavy metal translocating P-type ATPase [Micrococcales bacterium]
VEVGPGDLVTGATVNTTGALVVEATAVGEATRLAQIGRLVAQAQTGKAAVQRLADRVSAVFVPVVVVLSLVTFAGWVVAGGGTTAAFTAAVAVLIIACPCALGLATPTALLVGTGRGAQLGIVIKGPEVLERTRTVDTVVLDKTGTITAGQMAVVDVLAVDGHDVGEVLALAAAVEARSEHPVAHAIVLAHTARSCTGPGVGPPVPPVAHGAGPAGTTGVSGASDAGTVDWRDAAGVGTKTGGRSGCDLGDCGGQDVHADLGASSPGVVFGDDVPAVGRGSGRAAASPPCGEVVGFRAVPGGGVLGDVELAAGSRRVLVGTAGWLADEGVQTDAVAGFVDQVEQDAATAVVVAWDGVARGVVALRDPVRPTARQAVSELAGLGLGAVLLTGDNERTAQAVAAQVGVAQVRAQVSPEDKQAEVQRLQAAGRTVAMVGDGINDAAALAQADLGLAFGTGADVAVQAADVTLVRADPMLVPQAVRLSRATLRIIKQNLAWAFGYNLAALPLAAAGLLNPMVAGAAMAASSVLVVTNSLRLRRFEQPPRHRGQRFASNATCLDVDLDARPRGDRWGPSTS